MTFRYKFGKTPARPRAVKLRFSSYLDKAELPKHPHDFGHERLVAPKGWGMLGNDKYGCCVWAGAAHETRMWAYEGGVYGGAWFRDKDVLSDYSAVTGFKPDDPNTDNGTDMQLAAKYRQDTGIVDGHGKRHKVGAYLALDAGNLEQHLTAAWLFGAVGIGVQCPESMMGQTDRGEPWDVVSGSKVEGGHYIPLVSSRKGMLSVVTWGATQQMTTAFFSKYNDESIVYLSPEMLTNGKSPEAFDYQTLQTDLQGLKSA